MVFFDSDFEKVIEAIWIVFVLLCIFIIFGKQKNTTSTNEICTQLNLFMPGATIM